MRFIVYKTLNALPISWEKLNAQRCQNYWCYIMDALPKDYDTADHVICHISAPN